MRTEQFVWALPLDPRTGVAAGPEHRLSGNSGDVPSIAPDGQWVAFARDDSTGVGQSVVVVSIRGETERVVAPALPSSVANIRWTPDGKTLYIGVNPPVACVPMFSCLPLPQGDRQSSASIRRAAIEGGQISVIAKVGNPSPGLSPDGRTLAYGDTGNSRRLVIADTGGRRIDSIVLRATENASVWLRASTLLKYTAGDVRRLRTMSLANSQGRALFESTDFVVQPSWSPDGKMVAVIRATEGPPELRIMDANGSLRKAISLAVNFVSGIAWSPDQQRIAYLAFRPNEPPNVSVVEIATGRSTRLRELRPNASATIWWLSDSRGVMVSEIHGGSGQDRRLSVLRLNLAGTGALVRDVALGPTPSRGFAVTDTTALVSRATTRDYRLVGLTREISERVILPEQPGFSSVPVLSLDRQWLAIRRNPAGNDNQRMNVLELVHTSGSPRTTIQLPFFALPGESNPLILPGGKELIVLENRSPDTDPGVYLVTVATRSVKKLFTYGRTGPVPEFAASSDGRSLLYLMSGTLTPSVSTLDLSPVFRTGRR
jgi:dipeptidyl aminopeptidase/acylaminoacyl peptidase